MKSHRFLQLPCVCRSWLLLFAVSLFCGGCQQLGWTESGFREGEAVWKSNTKRTTGASDLAGLSLKAREVEANLGIE